MGPTLCLGIEGSANKIGVGIVREDGAILSNPRHTYACNQRMAKRFIPLRLRCFARLTAGCFACTGTSLLPGRAFCHARPRCTTRYM